MVEAIPSFSTFYTVTVTLVLMFLLSSISLYFNACNETKYQRLMFWLKLVTSIPLLLLGVKWVTFATVGFGVLAIISSNLNQTLYFSLLTITPIAIYALTTWCLIRWYRNKRFANIIAIILIVIFVVYVYTFQSVWLFEPLTQSSINVTEICSNIA